MTQVSDQTDERDLNFRVQTAQTEEMRAQLVQAILKHAIKFNDQLNFDFRLLLTQSQYAKLAGQLLWAQIKDLQPQVLIAPGYGSMPLAYAISHAALVDGVSLSVLMVRDKRKNYNQKKWIEGFKPKAGARAIVVDYFMSAGSVLDLIDQAMAADQIHLQILAVAVFFDMWEPLGSRQIQLHKSPVIRLFTRHDLGLSRDCHDAKPPSMKGLAPDFVQKPMWWRMALNTPNEYPYRSVPLIADAAVFVADDQSRVTRHNAITGDIEWVCESLARPVKGIVQQLTFHDDSLVYGCYDGTITRIHARTGEIVWRRRQDTSVHATPAIDAVNARVFINTEQWNEGHPHGHLMALDWHTGRLHWRRQHAWWPPASPIWDATHDIVVATCNDQSLIACQGATGITCWQQMTKGLVRGRPLISAGKVLVATETGWLQAFDLLTGKIVWSQRYGKGLAHQFLMKSNAGVMVFDGKWHWSCFDIESGTLRWITRLRSPACWNPVRHGRYLIALSKQGHIAVIDEQQQLKVWESQLHGQYGQAPAIGRVTDTQGHSRQILAAASNDAGLQVFEISPYYTDENL